MKHKPAISHSQAVEVHLMKCSTPDQLLSEFTAFAAGSSAALHSKQIKQRVN